jgi:mannose-6-phosphate isomerase
MGTYPDLPSYVLETGEDLQDVIDKHPDELIGKNVAQKFNHTKLPYLPKVLSIAKALPLQLHPVCSSLINRLYVLTNTAEQGLSV